MTIARFFSEDIPISSLCPPNAVQSSPHFSRPITRLPNELLNEIFLHLVPRTHSHSFDYAKRKPTECITVSHVCREWRYLADANPRLWTDILVTDSPSSQALLGLFLHRSNNMPIDVAFRKYREAFDEQHCRTVARLLKPHITRLRSLSLDMLSWPSAIVLASIWDVPANSLCTLVMTSDWDASTVTIPCMFNHATANLRNLRLYNSILAWPSSMLSNVTTLELVEILLPSFQHLLGVLAGFPSLHDLTLTNVGQEDIFPVQVSPHTIHSVHLPHLKNLDVLIMESPPETMVNFVSYLLGALWFPATTQVYINIHDDDECRFLSPPPARASFTLLTYDVTALCIVLNHSVDDNKITVCGSTNSSLLRMAWSWWSLSGATHGCSLARLLNAGLFFFPNVHFLDLHISIDCLQQPWDWLICLMCRLPSLTRLNICVNCAQSENLCEALNLSTLANSYTPGDTLDLRPVCPELIQLNITVRGIDSAKVVPDFMGVVERFGASLERRVLSGYPIEVGFNLESESIVLDSIRTAALHTRIPTISAERSHPRDWLHPGSFSCLTEFVF